MIVVDASVVAMALADDGAQGEHARARLFGETLAAPELIDLEVISALRRGARSGRLDTRRADQAVADLASLPVRRSPHRSLLDRIWELRQNLTAYDAAYVALAEALRTTLVTFDAAMSRAPGRRCEVELLR